MNRFTKYAWFVTFYNLFVIVWGAVVRATGSGAGCGNHWPTCNGQILPVLAETKTLIEFSHRLTSGLDGFLVLLLVIWAFRRSSSNFTRWMATLSFIFVLFEGAIGAALVKLELVAQNASAMRAGAVGLHLANTLFLLACLALTAWSAVDVEHTKRGTGQTSRLLLAVLIIGLIGMMVLSAAGAITALGDTLFPSKTLAEGLQADVDPQSHFLIQLRVIHPTIAVLVSAFIFMAGQYILRVRPQRNVSRLVYGLYGVIAFQIFLGVINIAFLAPLLVQVLHLLIADTMWLLMVLLTAEIIAPQPEAPAVTVTSSFAHEV